MYVRVLRINTVFTRKHFLEYFRTWEATLKGNGFSFKGKNSDMELFDFLLILGVGWDGVGMGVGLLFRKAFARSGNSLSKWFCLGSHPCHVNYNSCNANKVFPLRIETREAIPCFQKLSRFAKGQTLSGVYTHFM